VTALTEVFRDLGIALLIGALIGAERGHAGSRDDEQLLGLRTFILVAEAGAVAALLSVWMDAPSVFVGALVGMMGLVAVSYWSMVRKYPQAVGLTTEVAAVVVFLLGASVVVTDPEVPVALAIVTGLVLALKDPLHAGIARLGNEDILAALKLLSATFIVLPLLPREPIDPWGALNLYSLWWLVILIASISLVGYVGVRWLGARRGTLLTALFGGLVSSTAVTLALARRSADAPVLSRAIAAGVLVAWTTMAVRVVVEVAVVAPSLVSAVVLPLGGMTVAGGIGARVAWRRAALDERSEGAEELLVRNPFSLTGALKIGALFAVVLIAVKAAQLYLPTSGIYAVSVLAGLTDVDAITLSLAGAVKAGELASVVAVRGIVLAALANTATKLGLIVYLGDRTLAKTVALWTVVMAVATVPGTILLQ